MNLRITQMRDVKVRQGWGHPTASVHKCGLPHSEIAARMMINIYPDYRDTWRFKTKIRIIVTGSLRIGKKHHPTLM